MSQPLHERIRSDIETGILSGTLAPGDRLSTEVELMARYGCARMTVNKALSALSAAGLVDRRKRAGSFVASPRLHAMVLDVPDLPQEVTARGQTYAFRLIERRVRTAKATGDAAFDVGAGRVLEIVGVHLADDLPLAVEQRCVSLAVVPAIEHASFAEEPPGTWLLRNIPWTEAETRIAAIGADARNAVLLHVEPDAPLLRIDRRTWRGQHRVTAVRQCFRAGAYDLWARFRTEDAAGRQTT
ncbi:UTRA domain-containing protein [uncultured Sphingomonas sp.]|uniref:UTRA domain-containing protein n=1 Tax=uncultured Sphingomonas sp. TaxID=158754 RepID=UPI00261681B5|nr:UTRA domain-containing protein [uncultured Sphingomonas sp.]